MVIPLLFGKTNPISKCIIFWNATVLAFIKKTKKTTLFRLFCEAKLSVQKINHNKSCILSKSPETSENNKNYLFIVQHGILRNSQEKSKKLVFPQTYDNLKKIKYKWETGKNKTILLCFRKFQSLYDHLVIICSDKRANSKANSFQCNYAMSEHCIRKIHKPRCRKGYIWADCWEK